MILSENSNNTSGNQLDSSLKKIFWENFEEIKWLRNVLDYIMKNKESDAARILKITQANFHSNVRTLLFNINAGMHLDKFHYHQNNDNYWDMLKIINIARKSLWKDVLVDWRNNNVTERVASTLDWAE
jgi:hypothetical protein